MVDQLSRLGIGISSFVSVGTKLDVSSNDLLMWWEQDGVTKLAAEQMAKTGGGSIVNISSIMGFVGSTSGHPAYHASKGAVRIYSKAAAVRYGPSGVRVNTVHPGYMPPMLNATNAGERADKIAMTPLRRIGKPIEVAYGVLFLASDEASYITGQTIYVCGGLTLFGEFRENWAS